ncbi:CLUMA_CG006486, isoform A [Clunio marinus]|uniref:Vesicle-associated membrane protein 7 n=1 Tax=Clunio marinus TaxID=568069 RepID=A0A1J1HYD7_9DIPT|nr:CLUMA_CG006486, isoform A [Clunio marinus]
MPLLYTVISRGNTILCKYADCVGNFSEVTENLISKIQLTNHKLTYTHGNYLFHYICADKLIYMCITDDEFERSRAFLFLTEIKKKFLSTYGLTAATAIPYAMNTEFSRVIANEMKACNESREYDSITRVHGQIDELKDIMVKNIENVTARGERLELLVNKSENLRDNAVSFRQTSRTLARTLFWRNVRMYLLLGLLLMFIVYIVTSMFCGGLTWSSCR